MSRSTLWKVPPVLLFGQMHEDTAIERGMFAPGSRVLCIASAGCTAIALSDKYEVTAIDINQRQVDYATRRAEGMAAHRGLVDYGLALGRNVAWLAGWRQQKLRTFLNLEDTAAQLRFWNRELDRPAFRWCFDASVRFGLQLVRTLSPFGALLPSGNFGKVIRQRLYWGIGQHPNRANPYVRRQFLGELPPAASPASHKIHFVCADAIDFLESSAPGSFDAFALSNICDGMTRAYRARLFQAVQRSASKNATFILRSFVTGNEASGISAREDRTCIWGALYRGDVAQLPL